LFSYTLLLLLLFLLLVLLVLVLMMPPILGSVGSGRSVDEEAEEARQRRG